MMHESNGKERKQTKVAAYRDEDYQKEYRALIIDGVRRIKQIRNLKAILFVVQRIAKNEQATP